MKRKGIQINSSNYRKNQRNRNEKYSSCFNSFINVFGGLCQDKQLQRVIRRGNGEVSEDYGWKGKS